MSDIHKFLLLIGKDKPAANEIAVQSAQSISNNWIWGQKAYYETGIESKKVSLIDIVQDLGQYINDEDATIRSKTIQYLAQVIGELSPSFLSRQQLQVLCQFFCDRIEDEGAIGGLHRLQESGKFTKEMAVMTFRA